MKYLLADSGEQYSSTAVQDNCVKITFSPAGELFLIILKYLDLHRHNSLVCVKVSTLNGNISRNVNYNNILIVWQCDTYKARLGVKFKNPNRRR